MKEREILQKKFNKYLITFLIGVFVSLAIGITGGIFLDKGSKILGAVLLIIAGICFIAPLIMTILAARKYRPLIYKAFIDEVNESLTLKETRNDFLTNDNKTIVFAEDYFLYDNEKIEYNECEAIILLKNKPKLITDSVELVLGIYSEDKEIVISLNGDLLETIKNRKINIINNEDFDYFLDNIEDCSKILLRMAALQYQLSYIPLVFEKTKVEKKAKRKLNRKHILINVGIIIFILGLTALFTWLGSTKSGLKISESIAFNLGFKILFSIVILALALIKPQEIKWPGKATFILYLVFYWYGLLFLNQRVNLLIQFVFFILFLVVGIIVIDKKNIKNKPINRLIGFSIFIFVFLFVLNSTRIETVNENKIFGIFAIIAGVLIIPITGLTIYYYRKEFKQEKIKKSILITSSIFVPIGVAAIILFVLAFTFINLNYALDRSIPIKTEQIVQELEKGDDYESDYAVVIINDEEINIPISRNKYFKLEIGDKIEVSLYDGFFGFEYYIYEAK